MPKAATAARAFARPRGASERSELGASEIMAERRGQSPNPEPYWPDRSRCSREHESVQQTMAESEGPCSNSKLKAATAARAFARPRGAVEQSETGASEIMAERQGFEPWVRKAHNGFRDRPVRPLRHLSAGGMDLPCRVEARCIQRVAGAFKAALHRPRIPVPAYRFPAYRLIDFARAIRITPLSRMRGVERYTAPRRDPRPRGQHMSMPKTVTRDLSGSRQTAPKDADEKRA